MIAILKSINQIDQSILLSLNGMHNSFWDVVMPLLTRTQPWLIFYAILLFFIIWKYRSKAIVILVLLALAILISDQFADLAKETVKRLRPTHDPSIQDLIHNVYRKGGLYSFFSSHAANTFAVAMFTSKLFRNLRYSLLIFFWAALVSYTRIYLGVHYPFDILTGMVIGILIGHFLFKLLIYTETRFFLRKIPKIAETSLTNQESLIIVTVFVIFIATILMTVSQILHNQLI